MPAHFLDTSAIIKRYVNEVGRKRIANMTTPRARHSIYISQVALIEVVATFCRMPRENPPRLTMATRNRLITVFLGHARTQYGVIPVDEALFLRAATLCRIHPLRAYDAIQLASAPVAHDDAAAHLPSPIFVSADRDLLDVAAREGLAVENPTAHP